MGGGGIGELLLNGYKVSVLQDEKCSRNGQQGWLYNSVNELNASQIEIFIWLKWSVTWCICLTIFIKMIF